MEFEDLVRSEGKKLPVILLLDTSGSMSGPKIMSLNKAVKEMIEDFKGENMLNIDLEVAIITFGQTAMVHTDLTSIRKFNYTDLQANGMTPMGGALRLASELVNNKEKITSKSYKPTVVLVSDGQPNDQYKEPLKEFIEGKRTSKCDRWALGIGNDVDKGVLEEFLNDPEKRVFEVNEAKELSKFFKLVTMSVVTRSRSIDPNKLNSISIDFDNLKF